MKINTFVNELKGKSVEELNEELVAAKKELFNLRFQNATNQLDNTSRIKEVRKNIARIRTLITEAKKSIVKGAATVEERNLRKPVRVRLSATRWTKRLLLLLKTM